MKIKTLLIQALFVMFTITGVVACDEGPAENAGEKMDQAIKDAGNKAEDLCEDAKEGVNAKDTDC